MMHKKKEKNCTCNKATTLVRCVKDIWFGNKQKIFKGMKTFH